MIDHFERLGLPRRFAIDLNLLESRYLNLTRAVHPDFHTTRTDADLAASQDSSAALNQAYNTLKDPIRRAEYLLTICGGPSAQDARNQDPVFLAEMMDLREQVESAQEGNGDPNTIRESLEERESDFLPRIALEFDRYESLAPDSPNRAKSLADIRQRLNELKTIRSLLRDLPEE